MSDFKQHTGSLQRDYLVTGISVLLALTTVGLTALFLSESVAGSGGWLRSLFGLLYTASAIMLAYGISRILRYLPGRLTASFIGTGIVLAWITYDIISTFVIMPFSTSVYLTVAASLLTSVIFVTLITLAAFVFLRHPKVFAALACIFSLAIALRFVQSQRDVRPGSDIGGLLQATSRLNAPNPARAGAFAVSTFTYGSGKDRYRPEYGTQAGLLTEDVDTSAFIPEGWSVARTAYWGFDPSHVPLNGRVWLPVGKGPFPLVMIVHGTRPMTEFSDGGFSYLGELLASRGYIVASIDENFLNYGWQRYGDFKESDIDARGWIILQHLRKWRDWTEDGKSRLYGKVDMNRIALIGHSRGGEAIAAAAAFNRMARYPRNGNVAFDFHFNIRTLISLAPSDIYQPRYGRTTPATIGNVNYLLLLGTHDRQVPSVLGSRIFQHVSVSEPDKSCGDPKTSSCGPERYLMKAALFIYRANHSQFNTDWGRYDFPWPYRLLTDIDQQLTGEEQRYITRLYVSAFLDATLRFGKRYIPLFRDYRVIEDWLPKTSFISRFQDSAFDVIADFDEDIDPGTTTMVGGTIIGHDLVRWQEEDIDYHYFLPFGSRSNRVASVGWKGDKTEQPLLRFILPKLPLHARKLRRENEILFSISCSDQETTPWVDIRLTDAAGRVAQFPLKRMNVLRQPLHYSLTRLRFLEKPSPVLVLQTVSVPLIRFLDINPRLDLSTIEELDFVFNNGKSGSVLLDDIGFER